MDALFKEITGTMARDAQRKKASLNQFLKAKDDAKKLPERPSDPRKCRSLQDAEQYRHEAMREVSHLVSTIHKMRIDVPRALLGESPSAAADTLEGDAIDEGEDEDGVAVASAPVSAPTEDEIETAKAEFAASCGKVRAMNVDINNLLRVVERWDRRVVALGGTAVKRPPSEEHTFKGTTYFGAARNLPEYIDFAEQRQKRRQRASTAGDDDAAEGPRSVQHRTEAQDAADPNAGVYVEDPDDEDGADDAAPEKSSHPAARAAAESEAATRSVGESAYAAMIFANQQGGASRKAADASSAQGAAARTAPIGCFGCCKCDPARDETRRFESREDVMEAQLLGALPTCFRFDAAAPRGIVQGSKCAVVACPTLDHRGVDDLAAAVAQLKAAPSPKQPQSFVVDAVDYIVEPEVVTVEALEAERVEAQRAAVKARIAAKVAAKSVAAS